MLAWKRDVVAAVTRRPIRQTYDDPLGAKRLRLALQGYPWRSRALRCDLDQIVIVTGSQQGLCVCARLLLDPGDRFLIENPGYLMVREAFSATGATAVPIAVDQDGLDTRELTKTAAPLAYVTPSHQFPLSGVMPIARRHQLLAWARKYDACIIEDDYDGEFRYDTKPVPRCMRPREARTSSISAPSPKPSHRPCGLAIWWYLRNFSSCSPRANRPWIGAHR